MAHPNIKIGVLFSQTGKMAVTENAHIQGVLLACDEINQSGGINGQQLEPILMNPDGHDQKYAEMATELLVEHRVNTIFGCCLSTSRKAVLPIIERFNGVLFYPSVYEGFEYSPNVIYGGAVPNQMVLPLLEYLFQYHGRRIALIGSDTLYAREINRIVKEFLNESDGHTVTEIYLPFGAGVDQIKAVLDQIDGTQVDVILSTMVGEDSVVLYEAHAQTQLSALNVPIASLTTTESELKKVPQKARKGHLSVAPYFGTLNSPQNSAFVKAFSGRYGETSSPSVYSEVGYSLVQFYANAVRLSGGFDTNNILKALSGAVFKAPGGDLFIDIETNHFTLRPHIGRSDENGLFDIVWDSPSTVRPDPYLVAYDRSISARTA